LFDLPNCFYQHKTDRNVLMSDIAVDYWGSVPLESLDNGLSEAQQFPLRIRIILM
jgi:hypothetical protein